MGPPSRRTIGVTSRATLKGHAVAGHVDYCFPCKAAVAARVLLFASSAAFRRAKSETL